MSIDDFIEMQYVLGWTHAQHFGEWGSLAQKEEEDNWAEPSKISQSLAR